MYVYVFSFLIRVCSSENARIESPDEVNIMYSSKKKKIVKKKKDRVYFYTRKHKHKRTRFSTCFQFTMQRFSRLTHGDSFFIASIALLPLLHSIFYDIKMFKYTGIFSSCRFQLTCVEICETETDVTWDRLGAKWIASRMVLPVYMERQDKIESYFLELCFKRTRIRCEHLNRNSAPAHWTRHNSSPLAKMNEIFVFISLSWFSILRSLNAMCAAHNFSAPFSILLFIQFTNTQNILFQFWKRVINPI